MGKAESRVESYLNGNAPLGCSGGMDCVFTGTTENFQNERQIWIQNCAAATRGGFLGPSDKTRTNACQAAFDRSTSGIRYEEYAAADAEKSLVISNLGKDNPIVYVLGFLFVGLVIWLLMS